MGRFIVELIDQAVAMIVIITIILTFAWPFTPDGFWSTKLKYLWLGTITGLVWVFLPITIEFVRAVYKDWKVTKWK
ncbi:hypothetical protein AH04_219 [Erwinia phage AH04]|uniref:Uncharacterized protein n=1 Tax=Erwinia phage AH04 TaxID=2869569 RepID=A0AAE8BQ67_9CAUD|nr:hypothetical protein PQC02_gp095 [Erwinia phage AH04]QZA70694.1 hypothetical protein AH04_219 [Erwinia phage AH04]